MAMHSKGEEQHILGWAIIFLRLKSCFPGGHLAFQILVCTQCTRLKGIKYCVSVHIHICKVGSATNACPHCYITTHFDM